MKKSKIFDGYDLSGVTSLHGLSLEQYYSLLKYQNFRCPISGFEFVYDSDKKRFIDSRDGTWVTAKGKPIPRKAPPLDHDHETGYIRGLLSENLNLLETQWRHGTYGSIMEPVELMIYRDDPPAYKCIGKVKFK